MPTIRSKAKPTAPRMPLQMPLVRGPMAFCAHGSTWLVRKSMPSEYRSVMRPASQTAISLLLFSSSCAQRYTFR